MNRLVSQQAGMSLKLDSLNSDIYNLSYMNLVVCGKSS